MERVNYWLSKRVETFERFDESNAFSISHLRRSATSKKVKDLKVLDGKAAQNILILLNGTLKHMSYEEVKSCLLKCKGPVVSDNILQGLIQYLPPPDQLSKLQLYKDQYDDLTEAEQFCITVSNGSLTLSVVKIYINKYKRGVIGIDDQEVVAETEIAELHVTIRGIGARRETEHSSGYGSLRGS